MSWLPGQSEALPSSLDPLLYKYISQYWGSWLNPYSNLKNPVLLTGYKGIPLEAVAHYLVAQQVCQERTSSPSFRPCFQCQACESLFNDSELHIQVLKPDGHFIKVDQVREMLNFLSYQREHLTMILIKDTHLMNPQAANAMLKTLEEPPHNCGFIMTSYSSQSVLTTLRSRAVIIPVPPVNFPQCLSLMDAPPSLSALDLKYIQGRWDRFKEREYYFSKRSEIQNCIHSVAIGERDVLFEEKASREEWVEVIEVLRFLLIQELEGSSPYEWSSFADRLNEFESALWGNVDLKVIEEQLVYLLKENHVFH